MTTTTLEPNLASVAQASLADQFAKDGYVVARRMFTPAQMQTFIAEVQSFEHKSDRAEPLDQGGMRFYSDIFRRSEVIQRFICEPILIDFVTRIAGPDLWVRWDQAVAKSPHSGVFAWHQDNGYNRLPQQHFQVWIALSEMRKDNGGLWLVPGSHARRLRHARVANHFTAVGAERYDQPDSGPVFIEADAGDVVVFSSLTLGGKPAGEFVDRLACARDPVQIMKTLPLALRRRVLGPLARKVKAALRA